MAYAVSGHGRLHVAAFAAALLFALASGVDAARAAEPVLPLDVSDTAAPVFTVFGTQDGLSDEIWNTVGIDGRGFVWAGSASSLARFDGYRWTAWPFPEAQSLVRDMQEDERGTLWAIFEGEGLARFDGHEWTLVAAGHGYINRFSATHDEHGRRALYLGYDGGFARWRDGNWVPDPGNDGLPADATVVSFEHTQTLEGGPRDWVVVVNNGLWVRDAPAGAVPGPWRRHPDPMFAHMPFTDLQRSVDRGVEELWLLSYGAGLARIRPEGMKVWRAASGELPTEAMYTGRATYAPDGERTMWISTRAGLLRIRGDTVSTLDRRHGLPSDAIRGIKVQRSADGVDILWLATERGVARAVLTDSQWLTVSLMGARENGIFSLLLEPNDRGGERLWVGTAKRGLGLLDEGRWRFFRHDEGTLPANGGLRGTWRVPGPDGATWRLAALTGGALLRIDDALRFTPLDVPWPKVDNESATVVLARRHDGADELWFGTLASGVYRLRGREWTAFPLAGGNGTAWTVLGLAEQVDAQGRSWLWAAGNSGIARYDGTRWELMPAELHVPEGGFRSVALLPVGGRLELWAGSNRHGVVRLDVRDPMKPVVVVDPDVPNPPDPTVYSVLRDGQGRLYVCTNNGVQQLVPSESGTWRETVFRRRDGLVHDECNTNAQFIDSRDRYWAGTLGGLSVFDPAIRTDSSTTRAKPLYLTDLRIDDTRIDIDPEGREPVVLAPGTRELRVGFALLSGTRELESLYRSRLVGFDPEPSLWTPEHSRNFTALPPGDYQLVVEARDFAGTSSATRTLDVTLQPLWWQRHSVRGLALLFALALAAAFALAYTRNLRRRQRMLVQEVASRTSALNTANQRLTELSYVDPLTGVANRRRLMEAIAGSIERAAARGLPIGVIVLDVDHFKAYND
ncbi:MAG TPA: diguanylate cyclase, partial [Xanthomonadales bacterium]|nr:diguanylate cyclase [Xanthomonadales bacterium]